VKRIAYLWSALLFFWIGYGILSVIQRDIFGIIFAVGAVTTVVLSMYSDKVNQDRVGFMKEQVEHLQRRNDALTDLKNAIEDKAESLATQNAILKAQNRAPKVNGHG
jgi:hypothetical protein